MHLLPEVIGVQAATTVLNPGDQVRVSGIDACLVLALCRLPQGVGQMVMVGQIEVAAVADDDRHRVQQQIVF